MLHSLHYSPLTLALTLALPLALTLTLTLVPIAWCHDRSKRS